MEEAPNGYRPSPPGAGPEPVLVRIDGEPFTPSDLGELFNAALAVVAGVSAKARRNGGSHYVSSAQLERLSKAVKRTW